jgi:hypothetical protein
MTPRRKGLLLVTMEPPSELEEEFNDWYDTEHLPQRRALPGFESASRWVCIEGWPRWAALYDLVGTDAVATLEYQMVSGERATPWSRRILPRTAGYMRIVAEQLWPGDALTLPTQPQSRLLIARYRLPASQARDAAAELAARATELAGLLQVRAFGSEADDEFWIIAEFGRPMLPEEATNVFTDVRGGSAVMLNLYGPYRRASTGDRSRS